jgi:hypothetical protein
LSDEKQNQPVNPHLYHYSRLLGYRFSQTVPKVFSYSGLPFYTFSKDLIFVFLLVLLLGISYPLTITETESF